jgi:histidinol dehydrogenase
VIRIQKADEVEKEFFAPRDFTGSVETVQKIIADVKKNGDRALHEYSRQFDVSSPSSFEIPQTEVQAAAEKMKKEKPEIYESLVYSHDLALRFALKQKESFNDFETELEPGLFTGQKTIPVETAGVYVPAGRFPLVSTVIMTVTPAAAAGVKNIILCTPPRVHPGDTADGGRPYADEGIMAAAYICGVKHVYACGGSQAVAAMAFGTETIPAVDVIVGPGNKYVAAE